MSTKEKRISRRQFLKDAALAGAAVATAGALGSLAPSSAMAAGVPAKWDKETDVVVIGTGFAGLSAAFTVNEAGAKVVVLEKAKQAHEGGNSKVSGNMWWTPQTAEDGFTYVKAMAFGTTDDECLKAFEAEHVKLNDWLIAKFGIKPASIGGLFQPEHPQLPGNQTVRTWGNEGKTLNGQLYNPIRDVVAKAKIEVLYETPAVELVQAPTGEIVGVKAQQGGKDYFVKASRGVVMGCGGFEFDFDMAKQFLPGWPVYGRGSPYNTGDGIKMAQKVGAQLWHMNNTLGGYGCMVVPEFAPIMMNLGIPAPYIFLDKLGQRFMSESRDNRHGFGHKEYQLFFDGVIGDFTRNPWWTFFDHTSLGKGPIVNSGSATMSFTWFAANGGYKWSADNSAEIAKGWILKGNTIAELAPKMGLLPEVLKYSIDKYNQYCEAKLDNEFGRPATALIPLWTGPYYAVKTYPATYNTQGGPRRNGKCQIVDIDGKPIPRLYSAGEMGSFYGWMYNGGGNVAEALVTGQIAARNAVAEKPWG